MTEEKKFSRALEKGLDRLDVQHWLVAMHFTQLGSRLQINMWEMLTTFMNNYAHMYATGEVQPNQPMYNMCRLSYVMMEAMRIDAVRNPR